MPSLPRSCPECGARLDANRGIRGGKVRCPECDYLITLRDEEDDEPRRGIQTRPGAVRVAPRSRRRDDEPTVRMKKRGSSVPVGCILAGVAVGVLAVLVLGGGVAAFWYAFSSSEEPGQQPGVMASAGPVGNGDGAGNPAPWPNVQPVNNVAPAEPPREPIRPAAGPGAEAAAIPLQELKAATVYIKNETPGIGKATGSGFAIRSQGNMVLIVTNHHVIAPLTPDEVRGRFPRPGRPFVGRATHNQLAVVFRSGSPDQQERPATVVADDSKVDLAVLRVTGVREPPNPIDIRTEPLLIETKPVLALGFPFGAMLDPNKGDPAITITKGAVTSLRMRRGELAEVQVDCDLNPGNSGGPVVDEKGALVGVAVAKVDGTKVGFAVPVREVNRLLNGHVEPASMRSQSINGQTTVQVFARVSDPLGNLRAPTLHYLVGNDARMPERRGNDWQLLPGARTSKLVIEGTQAYATLDTVPPADGSLRVIAQVSYQDQNGRTIYGQPSELRLGNTAALPNQAGQPPNPGFPMQPVSTDVDKLVADLNSPDQAARQAAASALAQAPHKPSKRDAVRRALQPLLTGGEGATRAAAVRALASWDPKESAPVVAKLLEDQDAQVRIAVLNVLRDLKDARVARAVAGGLTGPEAIPSMEALKAMGPAAEKAVLPYLTGTNGQARFWAFHIIKEIGGPESVPVLEQILQANPNDFLAKDVVKACRERAPLNRDEWPEALEGLKAADNAVRTTALRRIAVTPPENAHRAALLPQLELLMNDQSQEARTAAMLGFLQWGGKSAVPALGKRLQGFDPGFHAQVLAALGEIKDETAAAAIADRLRDVFDRGSAAKALKNLGPVAEKSTLPILEIRDDGARIEACKVLAEIGGKESLAPLQRLTSEPNQALAQAAREALDIINDRVAGAGKQ